MSEFLHQTAGQGVDRPVDQPRAVVDGDQLDPLRQALLAVPRASGLDRGDGRQGVPARAHQDDAAHHLALPVELGDPLAHLRAEAHLGDVAEAIDGASGPRAVRRRRPPSPCPWPPPRVLRAAQWDVAQVLDPCQIAGDRGSCSGPRPSPGAPAPASPIGPLDGLHQVRQRQVVGAQHLGVHHDLVLLDHAADGCDLRDPGTTAART